MSERRDVPMPVKPEPKEGSTEWLEQLPPDARWAHTEVLAIYGDTVVNPKYNVALYHLRYAVAEVKRLRAELATARAADFQEAARLLEDTGHDDDAVNLLYNVAAGIVSYAPTDGGAR